MLSPCRGTVLPEVESPPPIQIKEKVPMATKPRFVFALEYVSDVEATKRFYVDVLGLAVERDSPTFVQFKDQAGHNYAISSDEPVGGSRELELYWLVDDAEAAFRELSQKADVSLSLKQLPFGKVFGVKDPTGQPQYLLELAQNRPSRRVQ
jgi:catechol 2,3-dioxygenase-like lactoylglutathione lyase family enzyme